MTPLNVGVIGLGMIGALHCRAVAEHPRLRLTAVADTSGSAAAAATQQYGATAFPDADTLLARGDVAAVIVCTPEDKHEAPVLAALHHEKHVLVEKPLATTAAAAQRMVAAARERGTVLLPGHILRFDPRYAYAYEAARQGKLGRLSHIWARRSNPRTAAQRVEGRVSLVFYLGIHDIDAALWISAQRPVSVYAQATSHVNRPYGAEDGIFALLRLGDDTLVSLEFSWALPERLGARLYGGMDVVGSDGMVQIDLRQTGLTETSGDGPTAVDALHWPLVHGRLRGDLVDEVDHFARCVLDGAPPLVTGEEAVAAVQTAEAILESIHSGAVVRF